MPKRFLVEIVSPISVGHKVNFALWIAFCVRLQLCRYTRIIGNKFQS